MHREREEEDGQRSDITLSDVEDAEFDVGARASTPPARSSDTAASAGISSQTHVRGGSCPLSASQLSLSHGATRSRDSSRCLHAEQEDAPGTASHDWGLPQSITSSVDIDRLLQAPSNPSAAPHHRRNPRDLAPDSDASSEPSVRCMSESSGSAPQWQASPRDGPTAVEVELDVDVVPQRAAQHGTPTTGGPTGGGHLAERDAGGGHNGVVSSMPPPGGGGGVGEAAPHPQAKEVERLRVVVKELEVELQHVRKDFDQAERAVFNLASEKSTWQKERGDVEAEVVGLRAEALEKAGLVDSLLQEQVAVCAERDAAVRSAHSLEQRVAQLESEAVEMRASVETAYSIAEELRATASAAAAARRKRRGRREASSFGDAAAVTPPPHRSPSPDDDDVSTNPF